MVLRNKRMRPHKKLDIWAEAMRLVKLVYRLTSDFPVAEKYGLVIQINRAAVSIMANIAEGAARESNKEYIHFLTISQGSLSEVDALFEISYELNMLSIDNYNDVTVQIDKVSAMLTGLKKYRLSLQKS